MKKLLIAFTILLSAFSSYAEEKTVSAVTQESPFYLDSFAIVDIQHILDNSKAAASARAQVSALKQKYINEAKATGNSLKATETQIKNQQKALSPEAFTQKVKDFQIKVQQSQNDINKKKSILQAGYAKSLGLIRDTVIKIVVEISTERNIDLVLAKGNILFSKNGVDVTDEVLNRLNKKLSKVTITVK